MHGETGQTPFDRFAAGTDQVRTVDAETLRLAFLWRAKRTVSRQATLSLQGNTYYVDPAWCGQQIELRYDPFDLTRMEVYRQGLRLGTAALVHHKRQVHLAVERLVPESLRQDAAAKIDFLKTLRDEHEQALRQQLGGIRFAALDVDAASTPQE